MGLFFEKILMGSLFNAQTLDYQRDNQAFWHFKSKKY